MGLKDRAEACGRCAMTAVTDVTADEDHPDLFGSDRIELSEEELRRVSPHVVALGRVKERLDEFAARLTYRQQ